MKDFKSYYEGLKKAVKVSPEYREVLKGRAKIVDYKNDDHKNLVEYHLQIVRQVNSLQR